MKPIGNTIFITGAGSGIGRGFAGAFHALGNRVIIGGRRREVLEETVAANPSMAFVIIDTAKPESIQAAAKEVISRFPDLNVLINDAGAQSIHNFGGDDIGQPRRSTPTYSA